MIVSFPLVILPLALITAAVFIFVPLHSEADFNARLVDRYNRTQGKANAYLDRMHENLACCGVRGQKFKLDDPTVFQPGNFTVKLPVSCCTKLKRINEYPECTFLNIYPITCSSIHKKKVSDFKMVATILLGLTSLFKVFMHFSFKVHSDSLFS